MKVLNIRAETIKLLEETIGINPCNLEFGSGFLNKTLKHKQQKKK